MVPVPSRMYVSCVPSGCSMVISRGSSSRATREALSRHPRQKKPEGSEIGGSTPPKMKEWEHRRLGLDDLFLFGANAEETLGGAGRKDPRCRGGPIDQIGTLLKNHSNIGGCIFGNHRGEFLGGSLLGSHNAESDVAFGSFEVPML